MSKITFFDLPSPVCKPQTWSPNTWKARFVLNYKRIPYKTVWVSYLDVEETLIKLGGKGKTTSTWPGKPSKPWYTLPTLQDESGSEPALVIDPLKIAEYLDEKFPEHPVIPKKGRALEYMFEEFLQSSLDLINTREKMFGMKIKVFSPEAPTRDVQWKTLEKAYDKVAAVFDKNGPDVDFVAGGPEPTRADFILTYLICIRNVAPEKWKKRGVDQWANGRWAKLLKRAEEWQTVDE
ncbi:hypothetical protein M422DRAFT_786395 [Sphaerobolus stellatus SS14]|uniref:GST N-terminal domain-containing protein n=1 Tax=Sphaerobolus stellatus (strain SS14) TaxID=990650 RepID=A0A0C9T1H2_SPHS4|nr:hypothetical protein M422DRAFT_786395 [Sphaerobolus stellatus SS14]